MADADAPPSYPCFYLFTLLRPAVERGPPPPRSPIHKSPTVPPPLAATPVHVIIACARVRVRVCVRYSVCGVAARACVCVSVYVRVRMCVCNIGFNYCHQRHQPTNTPLSNRISAISPGKVCFVVDVIVVVALFSASLGNEHTV